MSLGGTPRCPFAISRSGVLSGNAGPPTPLRPRGFAGRSIPRIRPFVLSRGASGRNLLSDREVAAELHASVVIPRHEASLGAAGVVRTKGCRSPGAHRSSRAVRRRFVGERQ